MNIPSIKVFLKNLSTWPIKLCPQVYRLPTYKCSYSNFLYSNISFFVSYVWAIYVTQNLDLCTMQHGNSLQQWGHFECYVYNIPNSAHCGPLSSLVPSPLWEWPGDKDDVQRKAWQSNTILLFRATGKLQSKIHLHAVRKVFEVIRITNHNPAYTL